MADCDWDEEYDAQHYPDWISRFGHRRDAHQARQSIGERQQEAEKYRKMTSKWFKKIENKGKK